MSRVAKMPIAVPGGVEVKFAGSQLSVKGPKGNLKHDMHRLVRVTQEGATLRVVASDESRLSRAMSGTTRALVNNMVNGVAKGFEKRLSVIGVGYRAQAQGKKLNLTLGYSHPVVYDVPDGITVETPSQTEIVVRGADRQLVGQVAADIRAWRSPEPYKGKGVRYVDEVIVKKEAKKK